MRTLQMIIVIPSTILILLSLYYNSDIGMILGLVGAVLAIIIKQRRIHNERCSDRGESASTTDDRDKPNPDDD
ncbi:hypothetical protein LC040_11005 [Bacillus tianshenii]|nr:hypothetical protein LC040_11005 [Bacillus tianshenii]